MSKGNICLGCKFSTVKLIIIVPENCKIKDFVETTQYFKFIRERKDRISIKEEWIIYVINHPQKTMIQSDGRIRKWAKIEEVNKYLRVILLEDGETVHNAFFDRSFKEK